MLRKTEPTDGKPNGDFSERPVFVFLLEFQYSPDIERKFRCFLFSNTETLTHLNWDQPVQSSTRSDGKTGIGDVFLIFHKLIFYLNKIQNEHGG